MGSGATRDTLNWIPECQEGSSGCVSECRNAGAMRGYYLERETIRAIYLSEALLPGGIGGRGGRVVETGTVTWITGRGMYKFRVALKVQAREPEGWGHG